MCEGRRPLKHRTGGTFAAILIGCLALLAGAGSSPAAYIFNSTPARNTFSRTNLSFLGAGYDWSGVGFAGTRGVVMISPEHFFTAAHFNIGAGSTVNYVNRDGVALTRTISSYTTLTTTYVHPTFGTQTRGSDLTIGRLNAPLTAGDKITITPIPVAPSLTNFVGKEIVAFANNSVGRNIIDDVGLTNFSGNINLNTNGDATYAYAYEYNPATGFNPDEFGGRPGDSGSPTVMFINGKVAALGSKMGVTSLTDIPYYTIDQFLTFYIPQLNTLFASQGGYSVQTIALPIPEPATLLAFVAMSMLIRRRGCGQA